MYITFIYFLKNTFLIVPPSNISNQITEELKVVLASSCPSQLTLGAQVKVKSSVKLSAQVRSLFSEIMQILYTGYRFADQ